MAMVQRAIYVDKKEWDLFLFMCRSKENQNASEKVRTLINNYIISHQAEH